MAAAAVAAVEKHFAMHGIYGLPPSAGAMPPSPQTQRPIKHSGSREEAAQEEQDYLSTPHSKCDSLCSYCPLGGGGSLPGRASNCKLGTRRAADFFLLFFFFFSFHRVDQSSVIKFFDQRILLPSPSSPLFFFDTTFRFVHPIIFSFRARRVPLVSRATSVQLKISNEPRYFEITVWREQGYKVPEDITEKGKHVFRVEFKPG